MADGAGVTSHIRSASKATGVSFDYLMAQAGKESAFAPDAKSSLSSAAGVFQFTKGTWLQLIKLHGASHGLGELADQIQKTDRGDYIVKDPVQRQKILALRRDPALSSLIAGEYARDNKRWLEKSLGRHVGSTELYLAHFLGPAGAVKLLRAHADNPTQAAAEIVPQAAAKNQTMFYQQDHSAQSVAMLYDRVKQVMENPAHPPHRQTPPAELAVAALRYGDLPWSDSVSMPDPDSMMKSVRWSIQAYTDAARSAARISAPMPSLGQEAVAPADAATLAPPAGTNSDAAGEKSDEPPGNGSSPINDMFRAIFG
jgi:hypothetical protein